MSLAWFSWLSPAFLALLQKDAAQEPAPWQEAVLAQVPADLTIAGELIHRSNRGAFVARSSLAWSADGRQVAYAGLREEAWHPVVGALVGEAYDFASTPILAGGHVFFLVGRRKTARAQLAWLWVDGKALRPEDWMGDIGVSADGRRAAYWAQPGAMVGDGPAPASSHPELVVVSEKAGHWSFERGDEWVECALEPPIFRAGGARVLTSALSRKGWLVLQSSGGRETKLTEPHPRIDAFSASADGAALAFVRADDPMGERAAIPAASEHAELTFRGKRVGKNHAGLTLPTVDALGAHVAYAVTLDGQRTVAIDDEKQPAGRFDHVQELCFDPAGTQLAFVVNRGGHPSSEVPGDFEGGKSCVIVRAVAGATGPQEYPSKLAIRDLVWDATGKQLAYCAKDDSGWRVVCGETESAPHDTVGMPHFAADGSSIGFGSRDGVELWWRVLRVE